MSSKASKMTRTTSLKQIAQLVGGELVGDGDIAITGVRGIEQAKPGDITLLAHPRYRVYLDTTKAAAIIVPPKSKGLNKPHIVVANPHLALAKVLEYFYPSPHPPAGVHPLAVLGKNPRLGEGVSIYPWAVLGDEVSLGQGAVIYPGAYIGDGVKIGAQTKIHSQVSVYPRVTIGRKVVIHSGSVIGSPGFGYVWDGKQHCPIPQVGGVMIEDEVEIGANVTIDRGTMGNTHIGRGVKIDNLVQIAHNVTIGEHSIVVAQVGIAGSAQIGRQVSLGGQVGVVGHIQIGDQVKVAAKGGVSKDVPPGSVIAGLVGIPYTKWRKNEAALRRLPQLQVKLQELQRRLKALEERRARE